MHICAWCAYYGRQIYLLVYFLLFLELLFHFFLFLLFPLFSFCFHFSSDTHFLIFRSFIVFEIFFPVFLFLFFLCFLQSNGLVLFITIFPQFIPPCAYIFIFILFSEKILGHHNKVKFRTSKSLVTSYLALSYSTRTSGMLLLLWWSQLWNAVLSIV